MPISNFIIKYLLTSVRNLNHYSEEDIDVARYGFEAVFWEVEKNLYFFLIFLILGYPIEWLFSLAVVASVRFFAGGAHVKSVWGCFFLTLLSFIAPIFVLPVVIPTNVFSIALVGLFSLLMLALVAPLIPENRRKLVDASQNPRKKAIAIVVTCIWLVVIFIYQQHLWSGIALWTIFLQNVQLATALLKKTKGVDQHEIIAK